MTTPDEQSSGPIGRDDIEQKLREITGEAAVEVEGVRNIAIGVGIGAVVVVLVIAFLLGRRRGRKRSTVVEIRRL